jgi:hypothetical protein
LAREHDLYHLTDNDNTMPTPNKTTICFDLSIKQHQKIHYSHAKFGGDLSKAFEAQKTPPLGYGLEFKPTETLAPLFKRHSSWKKLKAVLSHRSIWPLDSLSKGKRIKDIKEALQFGNHTFPRLTSVKHGFLIS